ncbi:hypothetical protein GVAV_002994 [Gurleya vavrai]
MLIIFLVFSLNSIESSANSKRKRSASILEKQKKSYVTKNLAISYENPKTNEIEKHVKKIDEIEYPLRTEIKNSFLFYKTKLPYKCIKNYRVLQDSIRQAFYDEETKKICHYILQDAFFEWYNQDAESQRKNKNFTPEDFSKEHLINVDDTPIISKERTAYIPKFLNYLAPTEIYASNRSKDLILYTSEHNNKVSRFNIDIFKHFKKYQALNQFTIKFEIDFIYQLIIKNLNDDENDFFNKKNIYDEQINNKSMDIIKYLDDNKNVFIKKKSKYNEQIKYKSTDNLNKNKNNEHTKVSTSIRMDVVDDLDQQNNEYNLQKKKHCTETSTENLTNKKINQPQQIQNQKKNSLIEDAENILKTLRDELLNEPTEPPKIYINVYYMINNKNMYQNKILIVFICIFLQKRNSELSNLGIRIYEHEQTKHIKNLFNLYYNDEILIKTILKKDTFNFEQIKDIEIILLFNYFEEIFKLAIDPNTKKERQFFEANNIIEYMAKSFRHKLDNNIESEIKAFYEDKRNEFYDLLRKNQAAKFR